MSIHSQLRKQKRRQNLITSSLNLHLLGQNF